MLHACLEKIGEPGDEANAVIISGNYVHTAFYICSLQDGNSPLTHACVENDIELVKLFCDYNANMNHQGKVRCKSHDTAIP